MRMHIYGDYTDNSPTILLVHPMLSSASRMKAAVADHMGARLRFLVPDLSAHGDEASAPYVSAAAEAAAIHSWLVDHGIRHLALGFGASLGGVVFFELLRFPDLSFDRLFIEGVSFYSGGPISRAGGAIRAVALRARLVRILMYVRREAHGRSPHKRWRVSERDKEKGKDGTYQGDIPGRRLFLGH